MKEKKKQDGGDVVLEEKKIVGERAGKGKRIRGDTRSLCRRGKKKQEEDRWNKIKQVFRVTKKRKIRRKKTSKQQSKENGRRI